MAVHREHQISGGLVASLDSVFYNDPLEGDRVLYEQLAGTPYRLAVTINPLLPCFEQDWMMAKTQWTRQLCGSTRLITVTTLTIRPLCGCASGCARTACRFWSVCGWRMRGWNT